MKIELNNKKIIFDNNQNKIEIHPIWLRERVRGEEFLDKNNDQRLFDPSFLENIDIKDARINNNLLELTFNDGVFSEFEIDKLTSEFLDSENLINTVQQKLWDSSLKNKPTYQFEEGINEKKVMYELLKSFYEYGFVIIKTYLHIKIILLNLQIQLEVLDQQILVNILMLSLFLTQMI